MNLLVKEKTIKLIDELKSTCQIYGMGNDGNEYKIITQVFLYKFINDKFGYEIKKINEELKNAEKWEILYSNMNEEDRLYLLDELSADVPLLEPQHLISNLFNKHSKCYFDLFFHHNMFYIAKKN